MEHVVTVGEEQFELGIPAMQDELQLVRFVQRVWSRGLADILVRAKDLKQGEETDVEEAFALVFDVLELLEVEDIEQLAAILLQFRDHQKGVEFVHKQGVEITWLMDALAINIELVDIGRIVESFRRLQHIIANKRKGKNK